MGVPWDVSGGVYESKSLSVSTESTLPWGLELSSDGTKAYIVNFGNGTIFQYTLSTAWDISSGSYASKSYAVTAQEGQPIGMSFSADGTKCYVVGFINKTIYQYTLSIAWDISSASYASKSVSVLTQDSDPSDLAFSSDGTKCYMAGNFTDTIYQYTLSIAWDISSASYASKSFSTSSQDSAPEGIALSPDGTKAYIAGNVNDTIFQYTLSTPWDISTATYALKSLYSGDLDTESRSVAFSSDGIRCYILGDSTDTIYQYILAVTYTLTGTIEDPTGTAIANAEVRIIGLSGTAWDLSTAVYASKSLSVSAQDTSPLGVAFSTDGTKAYVVGNANDTIYQYTLSTAWDVSTGTYASKSMSVASQDTTPIGMTFSADGTKAYVIGDTNDTIYQYTLSTAWDISTSSYASKSLSVGAQDGLAYGVELSADGTKAYIVGRTNQYVYQYSLSTAWDISTGSYASKSMYVGGQDLAPTEVVLSSDGTTAFVMGQNNKYVYQYTLSTAWDISTGSYASKSLSLSAQDSGNYGLAFSADGMKLYTTGVANLSIFQYTLQELAVLAELTADGSGIFTYTSSAIETNLQVVGTSAGPPRRFGATDNNLSTS